MSKKKEKLKFVFPNIMAKMMKKVDMRTQMESSMLSMFLIMVGMCLTTVYLIFWGDVQGVYKGLILFNLVCAFIFMSSFLVTTYQQYVSYMEMAGIDPTEHKKEILKRGNIFKRIKMAIKNKRTKKKESKQSLIVKDAIQNMIKIKEEEMKDTKKLLKEADKLRENNQSCLTRTKEK